jgi:hypothetical protein
VTTVAGGVGAITVDEAGQRGQSHFVEHPASMTGMNKSSRDRRLFFIVILLTLIFFFNWVILPCSIRKRDHGIAFIHGFYRHHPLGGWIGKNLFLDDASDS